MGVLLSRRTAAAGAALALVLTGCARGGDGKDGDGTDDEAAGASPSPSASAAAEQSGAKAFEFTIDDNATGPAPEIPGAVKGGTIRVIDQDDWAHLDPARIYVSSYANVSNLMTRTLTGYRDHEGKVSLVGDLATNTGKTTDGGKTWTFTLRDGITFEDGSAIEAADIKYGVERSFAKEFTEGSTYIKEWLADSTDFRKFYPGPYDSDRSLDEIEVPDKKTIVFKFKSPHPDMPFAAAMPITAPVRKSEDTKIKYDLDPFASGPYKITEHQVDKSLTMVRNTEWNPESDPIRHQFADGYSFEFGTQPLQVNQRLIAAAGDDARAVTLAIAVSPEVLEQVVTTPDLLGRTIQGTTQFVSQYNINNDRIKDLEVRKALLYALPREQIRQVSGGPFRGDFASTVGSPTQIGFEPYDLYNVPPAGDPGKAKDILSKAGKIGQTIVYAFTNTDRGNQIAVAVTAGLEAAGFKVVKKPLNSATFQDEIGEKDNEFDLYASGWGADWPSGSTVYPPTLDGRRIGDQSPNYSHFNDPEINKEMDRISAITDPVEAGREWMKLDRRIMEQVPYIPYLYGKVIQIQGPKIGGAFLDPLHGLISLNGLWVKP